MTVMEGLGAAWLELSGPDTAKRSKEGPANAHLQEYQGFEPLAAGGQFPIRLASSAVILYPGMRRGLAIPSWISSKAVQTPVSGTNGTGIDSLLSMAYPDGSHRSGAML
jgi:hypothetical protein